MVRYWLSFLSALLLYFGIQNFYLWKRINTCTTQAITHLKASFTNRQNETQEPQLPLWERQVKDFSALLSAVDKTAKEQAQKEQELQAMQEQIRTERQALNDLKKDIEHLQKQLTQSVTYLHEAELKNLKTLAATYSNMTPDSVVRVFNEMETSSVVKIMHFLSPDTLGPILQSMSRPTDNKTYHKKLNQLIENFRLSTNELSQK